MKQSLIAGLALAALSLGTVGSADAATQSAADFGPAAGNCQGALPAFAGTLRARPLAIGNEGNSNAFVTCGPTGALSADSRVFTRFFVRAGNDSANAGSITISCTFVHGFGGGTAPVYVTRSATLAPGADVIFDLFPSDLGTDVALKYPQVSCGLPPGGLVYYTGLLYTYQIGT